jgi:hypothetical protein
MRWSVEPGPKAQLPWNGPGPITEVPLPHEEWLSLGNENTNGFEANGLNITSGKADAVGVEIGRIELV